MQPNNAKITFYNSLSVMFLLSCVFIDTQVWNQFCLFSFNKLYVNTFLFEIMWLPNSEVNKYFK